MDVNQFDTLTDSTTTTITSGASSNSYHNGTSVVNCGSSSSSLDDFIPLLSCDQTLADILSDIPEEILSGCGPEEAFRPDYKDVIFPRKRPDNVPITEPTTSVFHQEEILDPEDNFYFESEHLALKGNKDYHDLLRTLVILYAQRTRAIKDLEELLLAKKKALEDPIAYVAKLQNGELPDYPGPQKIPELPNIDWSKFKMGQAEDHVKRNTRHANKKPTTVKDNDTKKGKVLVRGRVYDESKPSTFNQVWTNEEQIRLEALLRKYPPEMVAKKRNEKIAKELGNRTVQQVASRMQKYAKKLKKAGIDSNEYYIKTTSKVKKSKKIMNKPTTFFPFNNDFNEIREDSVHEESDESQSNSSFKDFGADVKQLKLLKQTKFEKDKCYDEQFYEYLGSKCYICKEEPIRYIKWHCIDCRDVDLCVDCAYTQINIENPVHPINHRLERIEPSKSSNNLLDSAYHARNFNNVKANYLDTNFCPDA